MNISDIIELSKNCFLYLLSKVDSRMNYRLSLILLISKLCFILLAICSLLLPNYAKSQNSISHKPTIDYSFKRYTLHDGLIQMQVTALFQDEKGFLWCGTKGGISRFDGKTFKNYSKSEAKLSGLVIKFGQDSKNNLLIFHPSGISKFDGISFTSFHFEDDWYLPDYNSNYLTGNYCLLAKKLADGKYKYRIVQFKDSIISIRYKTKAIARANGMMVISDLSNSDLVWIKLNQQAELTNLNSLEIIKTVSGEAVNIIFELKDNIFSIKGHGIYRIDNNSSVPITNLNLKGSFPKPILSVDKQSVFIKNRDGIYQFKNDSLFTIIDNLTYIRDILFDYEGNLWVATEEGLINFYKLDFRNYRFLSDEPDYVWSIIEDSESNMWFGSYTKGLWKWDGQHIIDYSDLILDKFGISSHFYMGASKFDKTVYFPTIHEIIQFDGEQFSRVEGTYPNTYLFSKTLDDGTLLASGHNGLFEYKPDGMSRNWTIEELEVRKVTTINQDKYGRYIVGGYNGISIVDGDSIKHINKPNLKNILCSEKDYQKNIWIGGINETLFLYDSDSIMPVLNIENNAIHSLLFVEPNLLLLGCRNGLFIFDIQKYYLNGDLSLIEYNQNNGFIGLECGQNVFCKDSKNDVWIATSDLVTKFNPKNINRKPAIPKVYIESLEVSKNKIDWLTLDSLEGMSIKYNYNSLQINFTSVCFSAIGNINYFYRLSGIQEEWSQPQKNNEVVFYNLEPGNYSFNLKANNGASDVETKVLTISFIIKPALWQKAWFIIASIVLIVLIVFLFIRLYFTNRLKKKEKELTIERIRTGLQVRALDNKSNHHFIFNILNNIGFNIIKKDTEEAYNLFSKLSWYFRLSLRNPDNITTSLSHQIETVTDYLFLQKNRLGDRLNYEIEMNHPELKNNEMPRNILQTIVDNSVTHGIEPRDNRGHVKLIVTNENGFMVVTVEDNGIGRQNSKNLNLNKKHGLGLNIYKQFFELFNKSNAKKARLEFTDLMDSSNQPSGTRVKILIPLTYNFIS